MSRSLISRVRAMIKWARVSRPADDTRDASVVQVTYMEKVADAVVLFPFGFHARVPVDQLALLLAPQGNQSSRVALVSSAVDRPRDLVVGEVAVYHPDTGTEIRLRADGSVLVDSGGNSILVPASGPMVATGDLTVTGDLVVEGSSATLPAAVTAGGTNIGKTHTHTGSPTAPVGSISNTGVPV